MNWFSPLSDKLIIGFFYGVIGVCLMYIGKALNGNVADLRQIVVVLALFYGGWIPTLVSSLLLFIFRILMFTDSSPVAFLMSLMCTITITQIIMKSQIPRSKQWYTITLAVMIEVYAYLWYLGAYSSLFDPELLHFAVAFILGSIFSYHFIESLRQSYKVMEELRQSKERLEHSEANYRLIAENSSDLIAVLSVEGNAVYLSPSYLPVIGLRTEQFIGKGIKEMIHPEDYPQLIQLWTELVIEKKAARAECRYLHESGHWVWIESHYMPVLGIKGEIDKVVVISRDVTERKQTEELIRETEKLSMVGELAAGIAHEIRNPLTSLKGFIQLMKKETFKPSFLDIMYEELDRIETITNELLYLGKPQVQMVKETNIKELLEQIIAFMHPQALLHNTLVTFRAEDKLPLITCVDNHLKQVFINLLKNALEAMPEGGQIFIKTKQEDQETLLISVEDQGIGIPEDRVAKLGEPFFTLKEKGTGLGLTVCKKIIKDHNGNITFRSKVGIGTIAEVRLPISNRITA
nr:MULTISPECIES: ATP-binding protein [unclassified Paenibacillus]